MPFDVPTLPTLIQRAVSDLAGSASDALRRSDAQVLARTHSGATHLGYGYLKWISKQLLSDTCDEDMLIRQANLRLDGGRKAAQSSTGKVALSGRATAVVDANVQMQTEDLIVYVTTEAATLDATGAGTIGVKALVPGKLGDLDAGTVLTFVSPVDAVSDTATVTIDGITGGSDLEPIEELRQRVNASYRKQPMGGNVDDYETWALEAPGVTRAWVRRRYMGPGTVGLFFVRDDDADPFPGEAEIAAAKTYVESKRPLGAELYVLSPVNKPVPFVLHISPDTGAVRAAVTKQLQDLIDSEGDLGVTLLHTHIDDAISQATGENDHELTAPAGNVTLAVNELPTFGGITWE